MRIDGEVVILRDTSRSFESGGVVVLDPRIREILAHAESIVRENATRLTSCLVLATES